VWDPDGPGPATSKLVVGGDFTAAGNATVRNIALYDPATGEWSRLGYEVTGGPVRALAVMHNGDLIAGGEFNGNVRYLTRWNGLAWTAVGAGVDAQVRALAVLPNGDLVAGGTFSNAGGVPVPGHVARWDQTDVNRPLNKVLFTLMKSGVPWATVEIVQNGVYSPGALRLRFSNGGTHTLAGNTDSPFCFLRGSQVLVTLRHKSGGQWSIFASVGGSTVAKAVELSGPEVLPEVLRFGDNANTHVEPMLWYGGRIWEGEGRTDEQITDSMRTLGMLYAKNVLTPPGL